MPVIDSFTKTVKRDYTLDEVRLKVDEIRDACLKSGSAASIYIEIAVMLYFKYLRHDPDSPGWEERDRVYWSSLFPECSIRAVLEAAGYTAFGAAAVPCCFENPLGIAAGNALQAKLDGKENLVVSVIGDADTLSGAAWEAADFALRYALGNLIGIVVPISGRPGPDYCEMQKSSFLADKYASFGWEVMLCNGDDTAQFLEALDSIPGGVQTPTVIIADTPLRRENFPAPFLSMSQSPAEASTVCGERGMRQRNLDYGSEILTAVKSIMEGSRAVELICADAELVRRLGSSHLPFLHGGTPANAGAAAAGLALGGKLPFLIVDESGPAGFSGMRIASSICNADSTVKVVTVLDSGDSACAEGFPRCHDDLPALYSLPGLHIELPCDALQAGRSVSVAAEQKGPALIRCGWRSTPCLTRESSKFILGIADILRYRGMHSSFEEAFESFPGCEFRNEGESFCLVAAGTALSETLKAACILKEQYSIDVRVLNPHTLKPLDTGTLERAMAEIGVFILVEDQFTRGFGAIIAGALSMLGTFHSSLKMAIIEMREEDRTSDLAVELILVKALEFLEHNAGKMKGE